ncbi:MAG: hypothetical protein HYX96_06965 [Chloroflexi bacterium]|nr:hypothetical protein [Chloroflexota bacterium]
MKRLSKIWGVALVVVMLVSLFAALPATAGTLSWSTETIPSATNNVIVDGLDIVDLAVAANGTNIYAATGDTGDMLYKSTDAGKTWTKINVPGAADEVTFVAVAPDDEKILVIVDGSQQMAWVSTNSGSTFSDLSLDDTAAIDTINDLDISVAVSGVRNIGVVGDDGDGAGVFLYFNLGAAAPSWIDAASDATWTAPEGVGAGSVMVSFDALKWSPNYASDRVATLVGVDDVDVASFHIAFFSTKKWNEDAGFTDYPVQLVTAVATVESVAIALDPGYLGADEASRLGFVASSLLNATPAQIGGLFRVSNTTVKSLSTAAMHSVAYNGADLVAGAFSSNTVYRSADATASSPTITAATLYKRPGLDTVGADEMTIAAWAGSDVVAGHTGDSSAFAVSKDKGATFADISLIDTTIDTIEDIYIPDDGSKRYFLSNDGAVTSLFRYDGTSWARIFTVGNDDGYIIRGQKDNPNNIYIADVGDGSSQNLYYSNNGGETRWSLRTAGNDFVDLAVQSADVAYIAVEGGVSVSKTTNAGFTWATAVSTGLATGEIATLTLVGTDRLIATSDAGSVAYSTDGNATWTKIDKDLQAGVVQAIASGLASGDYIYAATDVADTAVSRWQIGTSTSWTAITPTAGVLDDAQAFGIALRDGVLYVLVTDGDDSEAWRTLGPTASTPAWSVLAKTDVEFSRTPKALTVTAGSNKLWAIDADAGDDLYSFLDTLAAAAPTLVSPATGFSNPVNPVTGRSVDIAFSWNKPSDKVTDYTIRIYSDAAGTTQVKTLDVASTDSVPVVLIGPFTNALEYVPGQTYYWRVRVKTPALSPFSEMRSFTVQPGSALASKPLAPANGASGVSTTPSFSWEPVSGTTQYRFVLADNPALTSPIVDTTTSSTAFTAPAALQAGRTYFWAVQAVEPVRGIMSTVSTFATAPVVTPAPPTTPAPPITVTTVPQPTIIITQVPQPTVIITEPAPPPTTAPAYIWAIIIIGAVLVIAVIVLIVRTRRTV